MPLREQRKVFGTKIYHLNSFFYQKLARNPRDRMPLHPAPRHIRDEDLRFESVTTQFMGLNPIEKADDDGVAAHTSCKLLTRCDVTLQTKKERVDVTRLLQTRLEHELFFCAWHDLTRRQLGNSCAQYHTTNTASLQRAKQSKAKPPPPKQAKGLVRRKGVWGQRGCPHLGFGRAF